MAAESSKKFRVVQQGWLGETTVLEGVEPAARLSFGGCDAPVARFSFGAWNTQGKISFEDGKYEVVRQKGLGSLLRLERDGLMPCQTTSAGLGNQRAELNVDGVRYVVAWPAFDAKTILRRNGVEVGFVGKWRTWKR